MTAPVRKESGGNAKRDAFSFLREKAATRKGRRRALRRARSVRASRLRGTMSNKGGNKREKFLESVRKQKLDTVRWSLGAGGQSPSVRDDDGYTSIMIAAAGNLHKVLRMLCDHTRKTREREQMDLKDGAGDGRTALMMAAAHGHQEACQELLDAGCNFRLKCDRGKTAAEYASKAGHDALAARINRGGESEEEDTDEEDDIDPDAPEGETATQRSKRKKKELEAKERRGGAVDEHAAQEAARRAAAEAEELAAAVLKKEMPTPVWEEVQKAIQAESKELTLEGTKGLAALPSGAEVDPAVWWATATNNLKMCRLGMTRVPDEISRLAGLKTLILSNNNLTTLPDAIGD
jgi:leucine-rich repeat protein SHOC2